MDCHFYALMARMRYIQRWALMRNTEPENVQEHSHMVAVLAHALVLIQNRYYGGTLDPGQAVLLALYHDATEILTGDLPTPIKYYNPAIRDAYKDVEALAERKLTEMLPPALQEDYRSILTIQDPEVAALVKAADKISAYVKCEEEAGYGNAKFESARSVIRRQIASMELPEAEDFMREFAPSFSLPLDALN